MSFHPAASNQRREGKDQINSVASFATILRKRPGNRSTAWARLDEPPVPPVHSGPDRLIAGDRLWNI